MNWPEGNQRWTEAPLDASSMAPAARATAALHQPMPPTYGEVHKRVTKAIREAEMSRENRPSNRP